MSTNNFLEPKKEEENNVNFFGLLDSLAETPIPAKKEPSKLEKEPELEINSIENVTVKELKKENKKENAIPKESVLESTDTMVFSKEEAKTNSIEDFLDQFFEKEETFEDEKQQFIIETEDQTPIFSQLIEPTITSFENTGEEMVSFNYTPDPLLIQDYNFNDPELNAIYGYVEPEFRSKKKAKLEEKIKTNEEEFKKITTTEKQLKYKNKKAPSRYPKVYFDPSDEEKDILTKEQYYYFNLEKTLRSKKLGFIANILPCTELNKYLFENAFFDGVALHQHEKIVKKNSMPPYEQYMNDIKKNVLRGFILFLFLLAILIKISFGYVPEDKYIEALNSFTNFQYQEAYSNFNDLGNYENSQYYSQYCKAKILLEENNYKEAEEEFSVLLEYQSKFDPYNIVILDEINECNYQNAMKLYSEENFTAAQEIFKEIYTYSDATTYYYKCIYEIADTFYESGDKINAIYNFYLARKYLDSFDRMKELCEQLYQSAQKDYNLGNYQDAYETFDILAKYQYEDSSDMLIQCNYRTALNLYKIGSYLEAKTIFDKILSYKDSSSMTKECTYLIAEQLYVSLPVDSIFEYNKIKNYRDTEDKLKSGLLILYGEWSISELNNSKISAVDFKFLEGGLFTTSKQLLSIAISTEASPYPYTWNDSQFVTADGLYGIMIEVININTIKITATEPDKQNVYTCKRISGYEEMISLNEQKIEDEIKNDTTEEKLNKFLQDYIKIKTDNIVTIKGTKKDISGSIIKDTQGGE